MKRMICFLLCVLTALFLVCAAKADTNALPLEIGETIDVNGRFSIQITSYNFVDRYRFYKAADSGWDYASSQDTHQFMCVEMDFVNTSLSDIDILKYINGYVLYSGKYPFEGTLYQRDINQDDYVCYFSFPTGMLEEGHLVYLTEAPNLLETSKESLDFIINLEGGEYTVKLR